MRRFFVGLFIISLCAAGGTWYWKTYYPEGHATVATRSLPSNRDDVRAFHRPNTREMMEPRSSGRQDMAMTISILSSVISALAAVAQAWFARRGAVPPPRA
jgi:hypothetical protein